MINFPFFNKKINNNEKYLGLILKEQSGILMILSKKGENFIVQERINFSYSNGWENLTEDINENLSLLNLDNKDDIDQLIIFVYAHLVDPSTKQIKKPLLLCIKKMVEELDFVPLGYVEVSDAIVYYLKEIDNLPLNAILIEIDKTQISVFVYKGGQIVFKKIVSRTDNFVDDLLTVFKEKGKDFLPARIILYDSKDLDEKAESIISYRWPEDYFIQLPKVMIIKEDDLLKACVSVVEFQFKEKITDVSEKDNKERNKKETKEEIIGFLIGKDIKEEVYFNKKDNLSKDFLINFYYKTTKFLSSFFFQKILFIFRIRFSSFLLFFFFLFFLLIAIFINEWFVRSLSLTIYPETKSIEKELIFSGSFDKETDFNKLYIITKDEEFLLSSSKITTGEKEIGQKAKGEVIIFNNDLSSSYNLTKGTILVSENGLKFLLEEDVNISSASGDASNPKPTTAKGKVVASSIGFEYNLEGGSIFSIEGKSKNVIAKNESPFTGGTRNKIKTVSQNDFDDLRNKIKEKAKTKKTLVEKNKKIIDELTEITFKEEKFSRNIGEEANEITLDAKINKKLYIYDENQLKNRAVLFIKKNLQKDFEIESKTIKYNLIKVKKEKNGNLILNFKINGKAFKKINIDYLKKDLIFVSKEKIADVLKDKYRIFNYDFKINTGFLIFEVTPFFKKNIEIKVSY